MTVVDGIVSAGVGVLSVGVSVALQVLAAGGSTVTAGYGRRYGTQGQAGPGAGRRGGGGDALTGALSSVLAKLEMPRLHVALFLTGGAGLAGTGLGRVLNSVATWANHLVASWLAHFVGAGLGFVVSGAVLVMVVRDVAYSKIGPRTLGAALMLPCLLSAIPGPVGHTATLAVTWVVSTVAHWIGSAFGIH
ncbi:hypothetical protein ACFYNO_25035 [Kitasatospora sp. NPDC006697]|uniref:hypothetical protein n=1 Tax=Kitasatospora sp. NPDC006697 TaxID=3364020 RepID=UPI00368DB98D